MGKSRSATILIAYLLHASSRGTFYCPSKVPDKLEFEEEPSSSSSSTTTSLQPLLKPLNPTSALALVRQSRPFAEPNAGFMDQLELYHRMGCPDDLDSHPEYQRWLYRRVVEESNSRGVAPEVNEIVFSDEADRRPGQAGGEHHRSPGQKSADGGRNGSENERSTNTVKDDGQSKQSALTNSVGTASSLPSSSSSHQDNTNPSSAQLNPKTTYRCRRCRQPLATSGYTVPHCSGPTTESGSLATLLTPAPTRPQQQAAAPSPPVSSCAHIFLQPLSWMRPELEQGKLEGRLECPNGKCRTQVGRYAWQGVKCSCGKWEVPGLGLARGKVDELVDRVRSAAAAAAGDMGGGGMDDGHEHGRFGAAATVGMARRGSGRGKM